MLYVILGVVWVLAPAIGGLVAHNWNMLGGGLAGGYERLAKMNPHFVGLTGASGGQVRAVTV